MKIKYTLKNKKIIMFFNPRLKGRAITYKDDNNDYAFAASININGEVEMIRNIFENMKDNFYLDKKKLTLKEHDK